MSLDSTIAALDKMVEKQHRPKVINLLGEDIEIKFFNGKDSNVDDEEGYFNYDKKVIGIEENQKKRTMANTFFHEALHALFHQMGFISVVRNIEDEDDLEEVISRQISTCIQSMIVQNPRIFYWYCELLFPEIFKGIPERMDYE